MIIIGIVKKCQTSCIEQVRYGKPFKELWHSENGEVIDYIRRVVSGRTL